MGGSLSPQPWPPPGSSREGDPRAPAGSQPGGGGVGRKSQLSPHPPSPPLTLRLPGVLEADGGGSLPGTSWDAGKLGGRGALPPLPESTARSKREGMPAGSRRDRGPPGFPAGKALLPDSLARSLGSAANSALKGTSPVARARPGGAPRRQLLPPGGPSEQARARASSAGRRTGESTHLGAERANTSQPRPPFLVGKLRAVGGGLGTSGGRLLRILPAWLGLMGVGVRRGCQLSSHEEGTGVSKVRPSRCS